jgi:hypothetical protein
MTWSQLYTPDSTAPMARGGHTTCAYDARLFVFGGGSGKHFVNDLHVFDTGVFFHTASRLFVCLFVDFPVFLFFN